MFMMVKPSVSTGIFSWFLKKRCGTMNGPGGEWGLPDLSPPLNMPADHHSSRMTTDAFTLQPIGIVRSPYKKRGDAPRQGRFSDTVSEIEVYDQFRPALHLIGTQKHLWVLCWFDRADRTVLRATPPGTSAEKGVFAIRSPDRPNPVAICMVDLLGVKGGVLTVRGLDALDGTPVVDIKVWSREIDCPQKA